MMRRTAVLAALLGMVAIGPAKAETMHWATSAVAITSYSSGGLAGLADPFFFLADPIFCLAFSQEVCPPNPDNAPTPEEIQAAAEHSADNYQNGAWSASQATGAPNTFPRCGDISTAWAPLFSDVGLPVGPPDPVPNPGNAQEPNVLAVFYDPPVADATRVDIYETNIGGFVQAAVAVLASGATVPIYTGPDTTPCPGILSIDLMVPNAVVGVVIVTRAPGWEEIDAVGLATA